ncbi:polysaccharide biosynthesis C-terminal domain-containing protein [Halobacteria archaeon AArc-m2/3/4]|uniref:Polysaccharide biosynthesis C-terminal domain-containing protein n=1 Tax=Natronoglomus mannanivorans TaxID=2979990 RepID=A0ABT2QDK0_9EURY|nr:polysaccharide biosynthesis C-terminal domain-containing protein [Halobacteria archaeon AArc-m2/3/4]
MRLGQTSVIYFISKIIGSFLGFLATIYFARVLGEDVLGYYSVVLALVSWFAIAGEVGFSGAITKRVSEGTERDTYISTGAAALGTLLVVVALIVFIFRNQINTYVGVRTAEYVVLLVAASLFISLVNASLKGSHLVHVYAVLSTVKQAGRALLQIGLVIVGFELAGMLVGYALGSLLVGFLGLLYLKPSPKRPTVEHFHSLFDYAKFSWVGSVRKETFSNIDILVLGLFVSPGLVGVYYVSYKIGSFLNTFGAAVSTTLFPEMSKLSAEDDPAAVSGLVEDALSYGGLILIPGLIGGLVVGDRILLIYGDGFEIGVEVLAILLFAILVYTYTKQLLNTLNAIDRPDLAFRANGAFIVANVVLNVVLVYEFGWVGAAVATTISAAVGLVIAFHYVRVLVPFTVPYAEVTRQWFAAICMGLAVYGLREVGETYWVATYNEVFVVLLVSVGAVAYFATLFVISSTFRTTVTNNLPFDVPFI